MSRFEGIIYVNYIDPIEFKEICNKYLVCDSDEYSNYIDLSRVIEELSKRGAQINVKV